MIAVIVSAVLAIILLGMIAFVAMASGGKPSTSNLQWSKVGSFLGGVVVLVVLCWGGYKGYKWWTTKPSPPQNPTKTQSVRAPINQCSTPCSMNVGWDIDIKSGGRPVLVKFYGKKEWLFLSGQGNEQFTLDQFSPGEAQFASPENTPPVQVQLFSAK
jgi:hypothetical protein